MAFYFLMIRGKDHELETDTLMLLIRPLLRGYVRDFPLMQLEKSINREAAWQQLIDFVQYFLVDPKQIEKAFEAPGYIYLPAYVKRLLKRASLPFGHKHARNGAAVIDEDEMAVLKRMHDLEDHFRPERKGDERFVRRSSEEVARILNEEGHRMRSGLPWTAKRVEAAFPFTWKDPD